MGTVTTSTAKTSVPPPIPNDAVNNDAIKLVVIRTYRTSRLIGKSGIRLLR